MKTNECLYTEMEQRAARRLGFKARRKRSHLAAGCGDKNPSFTCKQCGRYVCAEPAISGVGHRNHCPYCLWSRHVDLRQAGDRLNACKGEMQPVGLTLKNGRKKYGRGLGELMLVHQCVACGGISINRIAADDLADTILAVYQDSLAAGDWLRERLVESGIRALEAADEGLVRGRLFGCN